MIAVPVKLKRKDVEMFLANAREGNGRLPSWADERIQWLCENLLWAMDKTADRDSTKQSIVAAHDEMVEAMTDAELAVHQSDCACGDWYERPHNPTSSEQK